MTDLSTDEDETMKRMKKNELDELFIIICSMLAIEKKNVIVKPVLFYYHLYTIVVFNNI